MPPVKHEPVEKEEPEVSAKEEPDLTQTPTEPKAVAAVVDTKLEPKIKAIKKKRKRSSSESGATRRNETGYGTRRTCGCRRQI
mmetsp:Transcript_32681/g.33024  ORF Transcript_32681/g.33024 Transcript_32681/m.33024 type:complete len:83 (-) Transcript_32681:307-555(-)